MTVPEILKRVGEFKPVSRTQLYHYFKVVKIQPVGARQKPQRFPDDAADKILLHLGFKNEAPRVQTSVEVSPSGKTVLTLRSLKSERNKRRGAK
jgi:hypothetical protein